MQTIRFVHTIKFYLNAQVQFELYLLADCDTVDLKILLHALK